MWWIDNQGGVHRGTAAQAQAGAWLGPYPTRAAAVAAAGGAAPPPKQPRGHKFTGRLLARLALRYKGAGYVFGGNASSPGVWDCSSFVSFVLHLAGLSLPGGKWGQPGFPPNSHGPVVSSFASWAGATTVSMPQAGDLVCYLPDQHIGIAISSTEMISALNPSLGTLVTPITGQAAGNVIYRRVNGLGGGVLPPVASGPGGKFGPVAVAAGVLALFAGAAVLAAAAVVVVVVAGRAVAGKVAAG